VPVPSPTFNPSRMPISLFISYSHQDEELKDHLIRHLANLKRQGQIRTWHDRDIEAGAEWDVAIKHQLEAAHIILLLISSSFLFSDHCYDREMQRAIQRHHEGRTHVIPIILKPCDWQGSPFSTLEMLPQDRRPITRWDDRDEALLSVVQQIRHVVEALQADHPVEHPTAIDETCPYQGLQPFTEETQRFFFGRQTTIEQLQQVLEQTNFVLLIGASGSGKSSVVRAGLMPSARQWGWRILEPMKPGFEPMAALRQIVAQEFHRRDDIQAVHRAIAHDSLDTAIDRFPSSERILLIVDQFEEIFTVCGSEPDQEAERRQFIERLTQVQSDRLAIVATMRADFVESCLRYPNLTARLQQHGVYIPAMEGEGLEAAILKPAQRQGYRVEPALVSMILRDVNREHHCLPLLQFALEQLWEPATQARHQLTLAQYEQLGGVKGALDLHAERMYRYRDWRSPQPQVERDASEKEWMRRICLHLVRTGEGRRDTRQRRTKVELLSLAGDDVEVGSTIEAVLTDLIDGRLLVSGDGELAASPADGSVGIPELSVGNFTTIDLAHEALMEGWKTFAQWRESDRDLRRLVQRIDDAQREWEHHHRQDLYLLPKSLLTQAKFYADQLDTYVSSRLLEYLELSQRNEQRQAAALEWAKSEGALTARAHEAMKILERDPIEGFIQAIELLKQNLEIEGASVIAPIQSLLYQAAEQCREINRIEHDAPVIDVAVSGDDRFIATSTDNRQVYIWDFHGNPIVEPLESSRGDGFPAIAFHPTEPILVAGGDRAIRIWRFLEDGEALRIQTHWDTVFGIAVSPNGQLIATGSRDRTIKFWDFDGNQVGPTISAGVRVGAIAFHPDGHCIAAALDNGTLCLWNLEGNLVGQPFKGHVGTVTSVSFSPNGQTIFSSGEDETTKLWNLQGDCLESYNHGASIKQSRLCPDTELIASCIGENIHIHNAKGQPLHPPLQGHKAIVTSATFSSDGKLLVSGGQDKILRIWDASNLIRILYGHEADIKSVAFSPDGQTIASGSADDTVRLWRKNSDGYICRHVLGYSATANAVAFSPDGQTIISGNGDGTIYFWEVESGISIGQPLLSPQGSIYSLAFSPDGQAIVNEAGRTICLWSHKEGRFTSQLFSNHEGLSDRAGLFSSVAFSPDGQTIVSGDEDNTVCLWSRSGTAIGQPLHVHGSPVYSVAFSPDGQTIASCSLDGTICFWNCNSELIIGPLQPHKDAIFSSITFSSNRETIAAGGALLNDYGEMYGGIILLWNWRKLPNSHPLLLTHKTHAVNSVAFSPNEQTLASGGNDCTVRLWRGGNWQDWVEECLQRLQHHPIFQDPANTLARDAYEFCQGLLPKASCL